MQVFFSEGVGTIPDLGLFLAVSPLANLLQQTGWVARIVLLILLFFSLFSWAIIFQKFRLFGMLDRQSRKFLEIFHSSNGFPDPKSLKVAAEGSPLVPIYAAGHRELQSQVGGGNPHGGRLKSLNAISATMQLNSSAEVRRMERYMPWLATTGAVAPFIGLFGTVWGVMDALAGLGTAGAASLRAVAPGISEALIATAAGLFAAIPAVIAYNHFLHRIKDSASQMDHFTQEFLAQVEKQHVP